MLRCFAVVRRCNGAPVRLRRRPRVYCVCRASPAPIDRIARQWRRRIYLIDRGGQFRETVRRGALFGCRAARRSIAACECATAAPTPIIDPFVRMRVPKIFLCNAHLLYFETFHHLYGRPLQISIFKS